VNLAGYVRAEMGLGEAARGMAASLESAAVPFNVVNFEYNNPGRHQDTTWSHKEHLTPVYDVTILVVNPDNLVNARLLLPNKIFAKRYVIGYWFWELPAVPNDWTNAFSMVNEVWVASTFMQEAFSEKARVPVTRIPPAIVPRQDPGFGRSYFDLPSKRFLFLFIGDASSFLERKNPLAVVRAFQHAFGADSSDEGLVLKISGLDDSRPELQELKAEISGNRNVYILNYTMSRTEMDSLIACCDCVVSLHRSEGFGLVPAEAMSLGKPVILTNWSGNTDYMSSDNCIGIDYQLVKLTKDYGPYKAGQYWAEPDVEQAAYWMKRVSQDPELARGLGCRGQETIRSQFSPSAVGRQIKDRLEQIRKLS